MFIIIIIIMMMMMMMSWIRSKVSFAILRFGGLLCLRGSRRRRRELLNIQDTDFEVELTWSRYWDYYADIFHFLFWCYSKNAFSIYYLLLLLVLNERWLLILIEKTFFDYYYHIYKILNI